MIGDWEDAPEWANFRAMDENGREYYYENRPVLSNNSNEWDARDGRIKAVAQKAGKNRWKSDTRKNFERGILLNVPAIVTPIGRGG